MKYHHGQIIEKVIRRQGHSITDIARLTGVNRRSVYNWFSQPVLKPHVIMNIGEAIRYDFSRDIHDLNKIDYFQNEQENQEEWKSKYIELLEKYNRLLLQAVEKTLG